MRCSLEPHAFAAMFVLLAMTMRTPPDELFTQA
jgi:hypothetical protein